MPRYSHSKNSAVRLGLKKHGYGIMKKPTAKENMALFQQAFIPTMPAVLAGMVRTGLANPHATPVLRLFQQAK